MGIIDKFKKWLDDNEEEFKNGSDKAAEFIEDLGRELHYAGNKVAEGAEEALNKITQEFEKRKAQSKSNPYESEPNIPEDAFMTEEESSDLPTDEDIDKDRSILSDLSNKIDSLIAELKAEDEEEKASVDTRSHHQAIEEDWGGLDDDFMKKAKAFADRKMSPGESPGKKEGKVKGFEDRDGDGDELIDDAEIES